MDEVITMLNRIEALLKIMIILNRTDNKPNITEQDVNDLAHTINKLLDKYPKSSGNQSP